MRLERACRCSPAILPVRVAFQPSDSRVFVPFLNVVGNLSNTRSCLSSLDLSICLKLSPDDTSTTDASVRSMSAALNWIESVSSRISKLCRVSGTLWAEQLQGHVLDDTISPKLESVEVGFESKVVVSRLDVCRQAIVARLFVVDGSGVGGRHDSC